MSEVGLKHDLGKLRWDLVPPEFEEVVKVLTFGAKKYEARNWEKGIAYSRIVGAILRHLWAFLKGERVDPETGLHCLAHLLCEGLFLLTYEQRGMNDFDDLPTNNRRDEKSRSLADRGNGRTGVPTSAISEARQPVVEYVRVPYKGQAVDRRQTQQPSLDPLDCCEYNGA